MNNPTNHLPRIWLQAAVLGSLWAASEIILGSFFHALHIPLRSMILASIGVSLMVAVGRRWPSKGLFWRAGLICALMKSLSPAGLILSPMVAILAQGCLMELSTRGLGRNFIGFVLGGILALCWNLFQYVGYHVLIYGFNIIEIYQKIYQLTAEVIPLPKGNYWLPVYVSLGFHIAFGLGAAVIGFVFAGADERHMLSLTSLKTREVQVFQKSATQHKSWSLALLFLNFLLLVGFFLVMSFVPFPYNLLFALPLLTFWMIRYRHTLRVLKKPMFWIFFIVITLLSAMVIEQARQPVSGFSLEGLWTGIIMNVRAFTLVIGLSVIGFELSNPRIKSALSGKKARMLIMAMEAASKALPVVIANMPGAKTFFKRPRAVFVFLINKTTHWLLDLEVAQLPHAGVIVITGEVHEGKTSLLLQLTSRLQERGLRVGGFYSKAVFQEGKRIGYDICDTLDGQCLLLNRKQVKGELQIGEYVVSQAGLEFGYQQLHESRAGQCDIVVIDEIGPWELSGNGWAKELPHLLQHEKNLMIWVVRKRILPAVLEKWNITGDLILDAGTETADSAFEKILSKFQRYRI